MISTTVQVRASRATTERTTIVVINVHTAIWATIRNLGTMSNTWSVGKTVQKRRVAADQFALLVVFGPVNLAAGKALIKNVERGLRACCSLRYRGQLAKLRHGFAITGIPCSTDAPFSR